MIRWAKPETMDDLVADMDMVEVFALLVVLISMAKNLMAPIPYRNTSS
jgi:hypothetical protein